MIIKNGKRLDGMGDSMPIGSIIEYNGTEIPDGWEILPGDANVYIGTEQPTEGQEVWIKQGKNIILTNQAFWEEGNYAQATGLKEGYGGARIRLNNLTKVQPNTAYYSHTGNQNYNFVLRAYDKNKKFLYSIGAMDNGTTFTTNNEVYYIGVTIYHPATDSGSYEEYVSLFKENKLQPFICLNSYDDKTYEPYVIKEINIKKNGVYETFYRENLSHNFYSFNEMKIGTWINGKPLYRRYIEGVFTGIGVGSAGFEDLADLTSWNIDTCAFLTGTIENIGQDQRVLPVNSYETNEYNICFSYLGQTKSLQFKCKGWNATTQTSWRFQYRIVLEYTKTTD